MKIIRAIVVAIGATCFLVPVALAQWPTTCVELNDIVESHLGNTQNVGIYQKVFGDQAEQACRNDHREDVRNVFAWAISDDESATQPTPVVEPTPTTEDVLYQFSGVDSVVIIERTFIKGGKYLVTTTQKHCITAILSEDGGFTGTYLANNCVSGGAVEPVTIPEGNYRLRVIASDTNWTIQLRLDK